MTIVVRPESVSDSAQFGAQARHRIHAHPELGLTLPHTQQVILECLRDCGIDEVAVNVGGPEVTSVVAVIRGNRPGRTIGFRADADALPLVENTGVSWSSQLPKRMHACGHDGHVATLLASLHHLSRNRDFAGTFVAVFQPGEEGYAGGRHMVEDGLIERFGIEEIYALHAEPTVPVGHVAFVPGYATANADLFRIRFTGKGGHGSRPHMAIDPVVAASECVLALQTIASRSVSPDKTAVVSVGSIEAGDRDGVSVIPESALLSGTARSYEPEVQDTIERRMNEIAQGIASAYGLRADVTYKRLYPAMYNDPEMTQKARECAQEVLGEECVDDFIRRPGGEDFSFMLQKRPGCLLRLGMRDETHTANVHNEKFDFNDRAIATGVAATLSICLTRMVS